MKTRFLAALGGLFLSFSASTIDRYPSKPVKLIVAYSEGSGADELPQLVAGQLSEVWKQSVVVEKKPEQTFLQLRELGLSPIATRPEDFVRLVRHEREKFSEVVREANIKLPE